MNALEKFIIDNSLNEIDTMNTLNDAVMISDNCVTSADVCAGDALKSVSFLINQKGELAL